MPLVARQTDLDSCLGVVLTGSPTVLTEGLPTAQFGGLTSPGVACTCLCPGVMLGVHPTVLVEGLEIQTLGDEVLYSACCIPESFTSTIIGVIATASATVTAEG